MGRHTLKKWEILRGRKAIKEAFRRSKTILSNDYFVLRYAPASERKVLFAVERRVRRAVRRNRIKRKLRETFRKNKEMFPTGIWIFIGKDRLADVKGDLPRSLLELPELGL
ncbi:MAG: ribonuclease P protein component [Thermotogae bacterium]|nr:ribonuclease P protein component [Thermotogota bacterium]